MGIILEVPGYMSGLYHKDVYLPKEFIEKLPYSLERIEYSDHAIQSAFERKITLPTNIFGGTVFEVEVKNNKIVKAGYSVRHFKNTNLCLVIFFPHYKEYVCGTVWLNNVKEKKSYLNVGRYIHG